MTAKLRQYYGHNKFLIVKVHEKTIKERGSLYEAARRFWAISPANAQNRPVLAMSLEDRTILAAYNVEGWHAVKSTTMKNGRQKHFYEFDGSAADAESLLGHFVGRRVPADFSQGRTSFQYVN